MTPPSSNRSFSTLISLKGEINWYQSVADSAVGLETGGKKHEINELCKYFLITLNKHKIVGHSWRIFRMKTQKP